MKKASDTGYRITFFFYWYLMELTTSPPLPMMLPASGPVTIVRKVIVTFGLSSSMSDILDSSLRL